MERYMKAYEMTTRYSIECHGFQFDFFFHLFFKIPSKLNVNFKESKLFNLVASTENIENGIQSCIKFYIPNCC